MAAELGECAVAGSVLTAFEYTPATLAEIGAMVKRSLSCWDLPSSTSIELLNVSENATFALYGPGRELVLRVHRLGYSSAAEICSELAWMDALRRDGVIETARAVSGVDGDAVQTLEGMAGETPRFAVAFERLPGREPQTHETLGWFERLGEITAGLHEHAKAWVPPAEFQRKRWDVDAMLGPPGPPGPPEPPEPPEPLVTPGAPMTPGTPQPLRLPALPGERGLPVSQEMHGVWGSWRAAAGLDARGAALLEEAVACIRERLERFGQDESRFGLIHADLRLANLLVDDPRLRVIDFDDCGFGWFGYDFAAAVSFMEHEPVMPELLTAWCRGYRRRAVLPAQTRAELPTFVVLRRLLLTAWAASHGEVPAARNLGRDYTRGTVSLAESWLRGEFLAAQ